MHLTKNFTLNELTKSQTATRLGINNTPPLHVVENLVLVATKILQPVRDHFESPVLVSSGYRSPELNAAIRGSVTSQHMTGHAVDFEVVGVRNYVVCKWIETVLSFDQLILEFYNKDIENSGWVHCSFVSYENNRKQSLTAAIENGKVVYKNGLHA